MSGSTPSRRATTIARASSLIGFCALLHLVSVVVRSVSVLRGSAPATSESPWMELTALPQVIAAYPRGGAASGVMISLADVPLGLRLLSVLPGLVIAGMLMAAALIVSSVLIEIGSGRSFGLAARGQLGRLNLVLLVGSAASAVLNAVAAFALSRLIEGFGVQWELLELDWVRIPALFLVLGLVAVALRYALQDGATLEREAEGVV